MTRGSRTKTDRGLGGCPPRLQWRDEKAKAQKAADILNTYVEDELPGGLQYSAVEVLAKIDNVVAKARHFYNKFPRQKGTGRPASDDDIAVDVEAVSLTWLNFQTFYNVFRNHTPV